MNNNKGIGYWWTLAEKFEGKELTDKDFDYCDYLETKKMNYKDSSILAYLLVLIRNNIQVEHNFKRQLVQYAKKVYDG